MTMPLSIKKKLHPCADGCGRRTAYVRCRSCQSKLLILRRTAVRLAVLR